MTTEEEKSMDKIKVAPIANTQGPLNGGKVRTGGEAPSFGPTK